MDFSFISDYWTQEQININFLIFLNLLGSLLLGTFLGYERSYQGLKQMK